MSTKDGGAAFPHSVNWHDDNCTGCATFAGMSLRDYFAAKAMCMKFGPRGTSMELEKIAVACYQMADAMLKARDDTQQEPKR